MSERIFLGYDSPFLPRLTAHLLEDLAALAGTLVIVPTSQSGRILRESLAENATALLAPTVATPGSLLHLDDPSIAPAWLEKIAWIETLESLSASDWENFTGLFPSPPDLVSGNDWAVSFASEIVSLRTTLQEHRHNLFSASKFLTNTPEANRWENLATLENLAEKQLAAWQRTSRSSSLRAEFSLPLGYSRIVLAGVTEMPPCLARALEKHSGEIVFVIAAPASEMGHFSPLGIPLESWATRELPNYVSVKILADPAQQAKAALEIISETGASSSEIALGAADDQSGDILARTLTGNDWPAFHPAAVQPCPPLVRWLHVWSDWLAKPSSRNLAALLGLPESSNLIGGYRAQNLLRLNTFRDKHPTCEPRVLLDLILEKDADLRRAIAALLSLRDSFISISFPAAIRAHLNALHADGESSVQTLSQIDDFLETATPIFGKVARPHGFWMNVLLSELPSPPARPRADRVIDVQGWLELLFEPGKHLVICGMNETFVPSRSGGEPWLSENIRKALGLNTDSERHARDAYLLHAMIKMREADGSTHLICGKNGNGGETYLPSRLLLQVPRENLVPAVQNLFREIEPPEANLSWVRDFQWQTPTAETPERISVTALRGYLACPFRFYLNDILGMRTTEPDRREMNSRDFGSVTHFVLECWGNDLKVRHLSDPEKLTAYLTAKLAEVIARDFGSKPPLAIRIQAQSIRQRLEWFAIEQAKSAADGWEIIHIERKFAIPSNGFTISGKIDRIDRHRETGQLRVIDYKTGKAEDTERAHRQKITAATRIPAHFEGESTPFQSTTDTKGKPASFFWKNLQLPLYSLAENMASNGETPIPTYIHIGQTEDNVRFNTWDTFSAGDLESAKNCADWITASIAARKFWPPSEKVQYDDFALLSQNQALAEAFQPA